MNKIINYINESVKGENVEHMVENELTLLSFVANVKYDGQEDDLEYLEQKLEEYGEGWNLQIIYDILSKGEWNFSNKLSNIVDGDIEEI